MTFILAPTLAIVALSFFISFRSAASFRNDVALNTTLPRAVQGDPRVLALIRRYKSVNLLLFALHVATGPLVMIPSKVSILILLLTLWIGGGLGAGSAILSFFCQRLQTLKREQGWQGEDAKVISVDLVVSREKKSMPVSKLWFLPPLVGGIALLAWRHSREQTAIPAVILLTGVLLYYLLYSLAARERARAYCEYTQINLALTRLSIRAWTQTCVVLAYVHFFTMLLVHNFFLPARSCGGQIPLILLEPLAILAATVWTVRRIRRGHDRVLAGVDGTITVDEDRYWQGGLYNNPADKRILVNKRVGFGYTFNLGSPLGKMFFYGTVAAGAIIIVGVVSLFLALDYTDYSVAINGAQVEINAPLYGYKFPAEAIQSVTTVVEVPRSFRTNGAETKKYCLGNFTVDDYGKSKLYVYKDNPYVIVIELPDLYIFFNARTREETEEYFALLSEAWE